MRGLLRTEVVYQNTASDRTTGQPRWVKVVRMALNGGKNMNTYTGTQNAHV